MENSKLQKVVKLNDLIQGIPIAMMTTHESDGTLRSRPMAAQKLDDDGCLWFFSRAHSPKVDELKQDQHVNLSYSDEQNTIFVSVSGRAQVVKDPEKARELWQPSYKQWFAKGLDDPDLTLIQVKVERAEYWNSQAYTMERVQTRGPAGENEKFDLAG